MNNKVLQLEFKTQDGRKRNLKINTPEDGLAQATVEAAMDAIIQADAFYADNIGLYAEKVGAQYVETIETEIFDLEA